MDHFDPVLISAVMPCHNAAATLEKSVGSVLQQTYPHVQLVVVDDGSTDGSSEILQRLAMAHPERMLLIYQNRAGPYAARNQALAHANGNYITFLDAGDLWHPDALFTMHAALESSLAEVAYCGWEHAIPASTDRPADRLPDFDPTSAIIDILEQGPWPLNSVLIRRQLIDELRGFSERAPTAMDIELWLRLFARQPRLARVPQTLAFPCSTLPGKSQIPHWQKIFDAVEVHSHFARHHPGCVAHIPSARLRKLIYDPLLREAYRCHWRNDTVSAHRLFRRALLHSDWKAADLKHLLASLLPTLLYVSLVNFITQRRSPTR